MIAEKIHAMNFHHAFFQLSCRYIHYGTKKLRTPRFFEKQLKHQII